MESLIAALGIAAGAGWGVAGGLAIALWVALRIAPRAPKPHGGIHETEIEWPNFGQQGRRERA